MRFNREKKLVLFALAVCFGLISFARAQELTECTDLKMNGYWKRRYLTDPQKPIFYLIQQSGCQVSIRELTGHAQGALWRIDLSGTIPVEIPRELINLHSRSRLVSSAIIMQNIKPVVHLTGAHTSPTMIGEARVEADTRLSLPLLDRMTANLKGIGFVEIHNEENEPYAQHIVFVTRSIRITDFNVPILKLNAEEKQKSITLLNLVSRALAPLLSWFWDDQMTLTRVHEAEARRAQN